MTNDLETEEEKQLARYLKSIARITGQESRGFDMCAILISQNATGLSWIRKSASMVVAHQVLAFSERLLVCNEDRDLARSMNTWPKGRTLIYGLGLEEGPAVYQQPLIRTTREHVQPEPYEAENFSDFSDVEIVDETSSEAMFQRFQKIREMRETGKKSKVEILKTVYGVRPGGTKAYKAAEAEYEQCLLQEEI